MDISCSVTPLRLKEFSSTYLFKLRTFLALPNPAITYSLIMATIEKQASSDETGSDKRSDEKAIEKPRFLDVGEDLESGYSVNEKELLRKLDFRLLPAVTLLYLLPFLDRSNGHC